MQTWAYLHEWASDGAARGYAAAMAAEYQWVVTRETRRWKTIFGNRRSETVTLVPAKRNARRRTRTRWGRTVTEEWRLVDRATGRVLDGPGQRGLTATRTEEEDRYLQALLEGVERDVERTRRPGADPPDVDAEIERLKRDVKRPPAHRATLKFPDGRRDQVCCDAGHDSEEGARSHAEQIAAELGYDC